MISIVLLLEHFLDFILHLYYFCIFLLDLLSLLTDSVLAVDLLSGQCLYFLLDHPVFLVGGLLLLQSLPFQLVDFILVLCL
jgi:hypothetical protein